jgi:arabinan endo-1,5-alpha-L-arabinosidase
MSGSPYALQGEVCAVHDPAIAIENGRYYIFSTDTGPQPGFGGNLLIRCGAADNISYSLCGQVFESMESIPWYSQFAPTATNIWAPDLFRTANGSWRLYYAISEFGRPNSVIGLATRSTLDQSSPEPWLDQGPIYYTNGTQNYNAIDASTVLDENGSPSWMVFGSFWSGIQLAKLDPTTGKFDSSVPIQNIAQRSGQDALEGSFMVYKQPYYYLFASWNKCCSGTQSTYEVRVGRSGNVSGPFVDQTGVPLLQGGGTRFLGGYNSGFPNSGWAAGGGQSLLRETLSSTVSAMIVHGYDGETGSPWANIVGVQWGNATNDGWPLLVGWND